MAESLPVVAVSAVNQETAMTFIDELVGSNGEAREQNSRVWRVITKYYRAQLRVTAHGDSDQALTEVEAHIIYLDDNECSSPSLLESRARSVTVSPGGVLVVAARSRSPALQSAALALHYELVPLTAPEDPEDDEPWGMEAVHNSIYTHLWPNLQRLHNAMHNGLSPVDLESSDHSDSDPEEMLARCEAFADALAAVQGERETELTDEQWEQGRELRLRRAEDLLAAVTRTMR